MQHIVAGMRVAVEVKQREFDLLKEKADDDLLQQKEQATRELRLREEQTNKEAQLRAEQFQEQLRVVREQFQNLANRVLTETSDRLQVSNRESMAAITKPINDNFEQLQQALRENEREQAKTAASLTERLRQVGEQADKMDRTATRLTNALRGDSKQAGDWGELVLQELLDSQGFRRGIDYDVQGTIMDGDGNVILNEESGQKMRPDVVLHYPDRQDVVIDAKVSIKAYYDYVNELNEQLKRQFLDRHVQSLRSHVKELVNKDYSRYIQPPRTAIDFVIMYVPNEAALQVALAREPRLWQEAFDQKVFISSTQNLFAILRMIQIAWRQHRQTENQQRIVSLAEQLLSRVGLFTERVGKIGRDIQQLHTDYDEVQKSLTGRLSIVQKASELKKLGVKEDAKHPLPALEDEKEIETEYKSETDYETPVEK
jgi:DNA recombination protein RmuC